MSHKARGCVSATEWRRKENEVRGMQRGRGIRLLYRDQERRPAKAPTMPETAAAKPQADFPATTLRI